MQTDRLLEVRPGKRFEHETTENLRARIDQMDAHLIDNAWSARFGKKVANRALNRAFMNAKAVLAQREGDYAEAGRLRDTLSGLEARLNKEQQERFTRMQKVLDGLKERYGLV